MKNYIAILILLLGSSGLFAQNLHLVDGIYVNNDGEIYSGPYSTYYREKLIKMSCTIRNGKMDGEAKYYFESGKLMESGYFVSGLKSGKWERFSESGQKMAEGSYLDGKKDGTWLVWDEQGKKKMEMHYKEGEKSDIWYEWDAQGNLIQERSYQVASR